MRRQLKKIQTGQAPTTAANTVLIITTNLCVVHTSCSVEDTLVVLISIVEVMLETTTLSSVVGNVEVK